MAHLKNFLYFVLIFASPKDFAVRLRKRHVLCFDFDSCFLCEGCFKEQAYCTEQCVSHLYFEKTTFSSML